MSASQMIAGVAVLPRKRIDDERGAVLKAWAVTEGVEAEEAYRVAPWNQVDEVYLSVVKPDVVKGWHLHKAMTLRYVCVAGRVLVGLYDNRPTSPTRGNMMRVVLASQGRDYQMLIVPPLVWNGFRSLTGSASMVLNVSSMAHDPKEIERMNPRDATWAFDWGEYGYGG